MKVLFEKKFLKDVKTIDSKKIKLEAKKIIVEIENAKNIKEIDGLIKLKGYKHSYRIRIKDYRIGLYIKNNTVEFVRLVHRKDIYRFFP